MNQISGNVKAFALAFCYSVSWVALWLVSRELWFLPAGLRLAALWLLPPRYWPWLALTEWSTLAALGWWAGHGLTGLDFVAVNLLPWSIYAGAVALMRGRVASPAPDTPLRMAAVLGAGLLAAVAVSPVLSLFHPTPEVAAKGSLIGLFAFLYGDFIGQLVLAPSLILLALPAVSGRSRLPTRMLRELGMFALPALLALAMLLVWAHELGVYLFLLVFAPALFMAFRHGWEGAALAITLTGVALEVAAHWGGLPGEAPQQQLTLSVVGVGTLLLGAASTALRRNRDELARQHDELAAKNRELQALAHELRAVSQRLVRLQERGQRELAGELHDELGQLVTALGTQIGLALREAGDESQRQRLEALREQVYQLHDSLRRALRRLRPAALDSYGLRETLADGPLRELLEDAGIVYLPRFEGEVDALDEDATTAIYRICQEAVFNTIKHARAATLRLSLGVHHEARGGHQVALSIADDGIGLDSEALRAGGHGLAGIRDRVLSLGGDYRIDSGPHGTTHEVAFLRE